MAPPYDNKLGQNAAAFRATVQRNHAFAPGGPLRPPGFTIAQPQPEMPGPPAQNAHPLDGLRVQTVARFEQAPPPLTTELVISESISVQRRDELPTDAEIQRLQADGHEVLFSHEALREALSLGDNADAFAHRPEVEGVVLTIDAYQASCLDNALSLRHNPDGTTTVGVHATDVTAWLHPRGPLDLAARRRAETVYFSNGSSVPMLPRFLSSGKLSLFEGQLRLTKSVEMTFKPPGELVSSRIFSSKLENRFRLDSNDAAQAAQRHGAGETHAELRDALRELNMLGQQLNRRPWDPRRPWPEQMLAFFTTLSGKVVGEALQKQGIETTYRVQPDVRERSVFDVKPGPFASANARAYVQWTAPMRSYGAVDAQRAMNLLMTDQRPSPAAAAADREWRKLEVGVLNHEAEVRPKLDDWLDHVADPTSKK